MTFLGYIPARKNSIRIKNKNIKFLNGKPLIDYTLEAAKKSKFIKYIYVSTDSNKIKSICSKKNIKVLTLRNKKFSHSKITMHKLIKYEYNKILKKKYDFKYLVLLQPTSPLRKYQDIDKACELILKNNKADCLVSTTQVSQNNEKKKIMYSDKKFLFFKKINKFFYPRLRNGPAILIINKKKINKYILGGKILDFKMSKKKSLDINTNKDFQKVKKYFFF